MTPTKKLAKPSGFANFVRRILEKENAKFWKKNERQLRMTLTLLNRLHLRTLNGARINELTLDNVYTKIILPLWVSSAEVKLNLLLIDNYEYTKDFLLSNNLVNKTEIEKWKMLIDFYFRRHYLQNMSEIKEVNVGSTAYYRYSNLRNFICEDLSTFIEIRNRLSHGQWEIAFTKNGNISKELTKAINLLTKKDLLVLKSFVNYMPLIITDLIKSKKSFEVNYDKYVGKIVRAKENASETYNWLKNKYGKK